MARDWQIGEIGYLNEPFLGYRYCEVVDFDGVRIVVRLSSGREITIYDDELEEK